VVLPTRELAIQVNNEYKALNHDGEYRNLAVYGGTEIREQCHALRQGVEILVATPGRLLDLLSRGVFFLKKAVCLSELKAIVLDEADEMLNMGF
jgi:superfamily II DNA/RNA helicase